MYFSEFFKLKHTATNLFNANESDKILNKARKSSKQGHERNDSKSNKKAEKNDCKLTQQSSTDL